MSQPPDPEEEMQEPAANAGSRFRRHWRRWSLIVIGLVAFAGFSAAALDVTDRVFSTHKFCAQTCHVMTSTVFAELEESKHWQTPTGVRADCADCHVSESLTMATLDHIYGTKELFVWLMNDFSEPGSFEEFRAPAAKRIRFKMLNDNSAHCKSCHAMEAIKPERIRGQNAHNDALENGNSNCIACHYNLVHKKVDPSDDFLEASKKYIGTSGEEGEEAAEDEYSEDLEMM